MSLLRAGMCPSLTADVLESLKSAGVKTVLDFVSADLEELSQKSTVGYKVLLSIRRLLLAQHAAFPLSGSDMYDEVLSTVACLTTGCDSLNKLLDDGIYTSELTEIVGSPASGKTQFCLTLAASVASSLEQHCLYVDTGGGFDAARLREILSKRTSDDDGAIAGSLHRVQCATTFDLYDLLALLEMVKACIDGGTDPFYSALKLVVLDSVTSVLAPLLGGKQSEGQGMMMHLARSLKALAADYAIAVVVCNNMVRGERGESKPALGRSWPSVPHTRILLRAERGEGVTSPMDQTLERTAWLVKSQRLAVNASCRVFIGEEGVYG